MDIKEVLVAVVVVAVASFAILVYVNSFSSAYDETIGDTFNESMKTAQLINNITRIGNDLSNTTQTEEASAQDDQDESILAQSRNAFTITTRLLGMVPALFTDGANLLNVPEEYTKLARALFLSVFALVLAFILLLGVKRLVG